MPSSITHIYCPTGVSDALKTLKISPEPALKPEDLTSPDQILIVLDCFFRPNEPTNSLPNPVIILHVPHECAAGI